jgi:hypothetical protein
MIEPKKTRLYFNPSEFYADAEIVNLTDEMADAQIHKRWWDEECLKEDLGFPPPIDRHWNWNEIGIEYKGRLLLFERIAILAGADNSVQGAMMISSEPVDSILEDGEALFLELLFTAPRNRLNLRKDGKYFFRAVGLELLTWAAWFSRKVGCDGRLLLDSSPDQVIWYQKRGLQKRSTEPIIHEGVSYTPMELSATNAQKLLNDWEALWEVPYE